MSADTTEVLQLRADLSRMTDERNAWRSQFAMGESDPLMGDTSVPLKLNGQREKGIWNEGFAHGYGVGFICEDNPRARAAGLAKLEKLLAFAKDCSENYDCDENAHDHQNESGCRKCSAEKVLREDP